MTIQHRQQVGNRNRIIKYGRMVGLLLMCVPLPWIFFSPWIMEHGIVSNVHIHSDSAGATIDIEKKDGVTDTISLCNNNPDVPCGSMCVDWCLANNGISVGRFITMWKNVQTKERVWVSEWFTPLSFLYLISCIFLVA